MTQPTIQYEDIEKTPAEQFLCLPHQELDNLIQRASRAAYRADTVVHWLRGLKIEKSLRESNRVVDGGADE